MAGYGEEDLISFASDGSPPAATPTTNTTPISSMDVVRPKTAAPPGDKFAALTNMARTRPWKPIHVATRPKIPAVNGLNVRPTSTHQSPTPTPPYQSIQCYLGEETFTSSVLAPSLPALRSEIEPSRATTNASLATASATLVEYDNEEKMLRRLEAMKAEFNIAFQNGDSHGTDKGVDPLETQRLIEVDEPQPHKQTSFQAFNPPPTPPMHQSHRLVEDNEPVVRLTQAVYSSIMKQISVLQKDKTEVLKKLNALQRELREQSEGEGDVSSTFGQLHYQLASNKDSKLTMTRDIRQKDIELYKKEMEIDALKTRTADMETLQKQLERLNAELDYLRTSKATEETAHTRVVAQITASKDKEIADLKAVAASSQTVVSDHATRAQNLVDTQTQRERKIKQLQAELSEEQLTCGQLRDEIERLRESLPSAQRLEAVQDQLRNKTSESDRVKNELRHLARRHELLQESLNKAQDEAKSLRGAAHLIIPSMNTRLPKHVFPCMECYLSNTDCDGFSRCHNCTQNDLKCARWRCSMRHVTGSCNQVPCRFEHDGNGWLMTSTPRPQW